MDHDSDSAITCARAPGSRIQQRGGKQRTHFVAGHSRNAQILARITSNSLRSYPWNMRAT
eukprot:10523689-Lingulodinium_polyedra.AAC.1